MSSTPAVALVTGASRGIGRVVAGRLARAGYAVALAARSADPLTEAARQTGGLALALDVTDGRSVEAAIATVECQLGPIALLVNNAGIAGEGGATWDQSAESWWEVFEVNVLGTLLCSRAALPGMRARGRGRIVNVASNAAFMSLAEGPVDRIGSAYMASKAAVVRFSEALDSEARAEGVRVFAISPGTVKSEMTASIFLEEWDDPAFWTPAEVSAELIEFIGTGALDALGGRYIHAGNDDWRALPAKAQEIVEADRHSLRVR
jgi:NAD(P)-dependent dehydrogenase (short-subunit alcohol dehydrogenase family)